MPDIARHLLLKSAGVMLVVAALSPPAAAQLAPGRSGFSDAPTVADDTEYWLMMGEMGRCLAGQKSQQSKAFLAQVVDSPEEAAAFKELFHRNSNPCVGNFVSAGMLRAHVRGVIAEGLFERLGDEGVARVAASPAASPEIIATLHDFARCYVVAHPADATRLLRETRVATKDEMAAFREMAADFAPCLPHGFSIKLKPTSVRFAIAEALYRVATGAPGATIASNN